MAGRLREIGGLGGWRLAMEKAEASNYLRRTMPGLPFFLDETNSAQLMRGRYDPERDPPLRGAAAAIEAMMAFRARGEAPAVPPETSASCAPPAPPPPPPDPLTTNLSAIGAYAGKALDEMRALADGWLQRLEAAGIDPSTAREIVADEARMVPKSWSALERLEERITARVKTKAA
jgi:hypothetical protein